MRFGFGQEWPLDRIPQCAKHSPAALLMSFRPERYVCTGYGVAVKASEPLRVWASVAVHGLHSRRPMTFDHQLWLPVAPLPSASFDHERLCICHRPRPGLPCRWCCGLHASLCSTLTAPHATNPLPLEGPPFHETFLGPRAGSPVLSSSNAAAFGK